MSKPTNKLISILCAVFNEEETIPIFYERLKTTIKPLEEKYDFEVIFTNNRSTDNSLDILSEICKKDSRVKVLTLSRNFGYQLSLVAGLTHVVGDAVVIIDVDCEDYPEMIPEFVIGWEDGNDIVYGIREKRPEPRSIELMRKAFYRITKVIADYDFIIDMAEFSLFSSKVKELIIQNKSTFPFLRNEIGYVGFKRHGIKYTRHKRVAGKSNYNIMSMFKFAVAGILTSSTFPLRLTMYIAFPLLTLDLIAIFLYFMDIGKHYIDLLILFNLMSFIFPISFISIYLARIYNDVIARPRFIIDWAKSIFPNKG
jgi:glycosyltransferase involved in cell wall biosynthesis